MLLVFFLISVSSASAYSLNSYRWPKNSGVTYTIPVKYGTSDSTYKSSWATAVSDWNSSQSKININLSDFNTSALSYVGTYVTSDTSIYGETTSTLTADSSTVTHFVSRFNTANSSVTSNATIRRSVANHELGHALTLADYNPSVVFLAIMNQLRNRSITYTPQSDDINGVNAKYPF